MTAIAQMPDQARLWVYQSSRSFTDQEKDSISTYLESFVKQWAAHGQELSATFSIEYDQFIILAVDEEMAGASGCSIDASVGAIRNIEQQFNVSLLDRTQVAFKQSDVIHTIGFNQVKQAIVAGKIASSTIIFNNSVSSAQEWKSNWEIPAEESWLKRHFK